MKRLNIIFIGIRKYDIEKFKIAIPPYELMEEMSSKLEPMMKEIQKYPGQEKQVMDYFKNNPEAQQQLSGPIFEDKIIDFILELANVKEKTVSVEELYKTDDLDLKKEAAKAKKSNKSLQKDKPKNTVKKNKVKS